MRKVEQLSELFKALSDPTRLQLIRMLSQADSQITLNDCSPETCTGKGGPLCVNALVNQLNVSQSAVSQHLRILRQAGVVVGERKGAFVHYSIHRENMKKFSRQIKNALGDLFDPA